MTDERVAITGNTYPVKEKLKDLGAKWNAELKAWMVPKDKAEEAQRLVASAGSEAPTRRPVVGVRKPQGGQATKRCWECGRTFTYAQARRNGGDWDDSYCGC